MSSHLSLFKLSYYFVTKNYTVCLQTIFFRGKLAKQSNALFTLFKINMFTFSSCFYFLFLLFLGYLRTSILFNQYQDFALKLLPYTQINISQIKSVVIFLFQCSRGLQQYAFCTEIKFHTLYILG